MDANTPGEAIRKALDGRSQGWLAVQLGIKTPSSVCLIVGGRRRLTPKMARRIALALDMEPAELLVAQAREEAKELA